MSSYFAEVVLLGEKAGDRREQIPLLSDEVPLVDLNATRVDVKRQLISFLDPNARALLGQLWAIGVVERVCLCWLQPDGNEGYKSKKLYDAIDFSAVNYFLLRTFLYTDRGSC